MGRRLGYRWSMAASPATRKTRATYAGLISAAREVVRKTGTVAPDQIAEVAGVSPATLYAYFGSKDALLAAAFDAALAEINQAMDLALTIEGLLEKGWEATARTLVGTVVKRFSHDARLVRLAVGHLPDSDEVRRIYRSRQEEALAIIRQFIRLGGVAGKVRHDDDDILAKTALVLVQSLSNPLALQTSSGPVVDEISNLIFRLFSPGH